MTGPLIEQGNSSISPGRVHPPHREDPARLVNGLSRRVSSRVVVSPAIYRDTVA